MLFLKRCVKLMHAYKRCTKNKIYLTYTHIIYRGQGGGGRHHVSAMKFRELGRRILSHSKLRQKNFDFKNAESEIIWCLSQATQNFFPKRPYISSPASKDQVNNKLITPLFLAFKTDIARKFLSSLFNLIPLQNISNIAMWDVSKTSLGCPTP